MNSIETVKKYFITHCAQDYVGLWVLIFYIKRVMNEADPERIRAITLSVITDFLKPGLIKAGLPKITGEFEEWNLSPEDAVQRIEREWKEGGEEPNMGDLVWFTTSEAGDDYVRTRKWL